MPNQTATSVAKEHVSSEFRKKAESLYKEFPWVNSFFDKENLCKSNDTLEVEIRYLRINHDFLLRHLNGSRWPVYDMPDMETICLVNGNGDLLGEVGWKMRGSGQAGLGWWKRFWENVTNPFSNCVYIKGETVAQAIRRLDVADKVCYALSVDVRTLTVYKKAKFDLTEWFKARDISTL
jgi:hypothetical protein